MSKTLLNRPCLRLAAWGCLLLCLSACRISFNTSGGNVDTSLSTLFVDKFSNEAAIVVPYLAQELTQQIQDRFLSQSRLSLTSGAADVALSGAVTVYTVLPKAIQGENRAAQNRLSISVRVKYENNVNPNESWEQTFSGYSDFDANLDFSRIEREQINLVLEQITQDIFSRSIGKW